MKASTQALPSASPSDDDQLANVRLPRPDVGRVHAPYRTRVQEERRAQRLARYQQVIALHQAGTWQQEIARRLGMGRATVRRYLQAGAFPERAPYPRLEGKLDHILPPSTKRIDRGRELRKRRTGSIADHLVTYPGEAAVAMQQRVGEQTMAERVGEVGVPIAVCL